MTLYIQIYTYQTSIHTHLSLACRLTEITQSNYYYTSCLPGDVIVRIMVISSYTEMVIQ